MNKWKENVSNIRKEDDRTIFIKNVVFEKTFSFIIFRNDYKLFINISLIVKWKSVIMVNSIVKCLLGSGINFYIIVIWLVTYVSIIVIQNLIRRYDSFNIIVVICSSKEQKMTRSILSYALVVVQTQTHVHKDNSNF